MTPCTNGCPMADTAVAHTCPHCRATSHHPDDVRDRYCPRCRHFCDDPAWTDVPLFDSPERIVTDGELVCDPAAAVVTRPTHPDVAPAGTRWVARVDPDWRLATRPDKPCRAGAGYKHPACGVAAVAELNRGRDGTPRWWAYCPAHLYGRWVEDGAVYRWALVEVAP